MPRPRILIVDDIKTNRAMLVEVLSDLYDIMEAEDGAMAVSKMLGAVDKPHLVLLDVVMPIMDGFAVMEFMKSTPSLSEIPVILTTSSHEEERGLAFGAVDFVRKPVNPNVLRLRVQHQIELIQYRQDTDGKIRDHAKNFLNVKQNFVNIMAQLIESRHLESGDHVNRTRDLADLLFKSLIKHGVYADELIKIDHDLFLRAVPLHDIGKISVPDHVLLKPGRLSPDEMQQMKKHTITGSGVFSQLKNSGNDKYTEYCHDICRYHHEWWDGNGYPDGLTAGDIPLLARIVAVVDVYDALVSERSYKEKISHEDAMAIIKDSSNTQFDPFIVEVMAIEERNFAKLRMTKD